MTQHDFTDTIFGGDDRSGQEPGSGRGASPAGGRPPRRRNRRWLVLLLALLLVGGACYGAYSLVAPMVSGLFTRPSEDDFTGPGAGSVDVVVKTGETGEDIATTLRDAGVVKSRGAYLDAAAGDPKRAAAIQPGTYALLKGMRGQAAFDLLTEAGNRVVERATIREGLWTSETFAALSKATGVPVKDYVKAAKNPRAIGLPAEAKGNVEGWLFPSTYEFESTSTAAQHLKAMVAQTVQVLKDAGIPRARWQRTLTIASIVEGEVNGDADRPKVARVILNRLDHGPPSFGLLQMDSTVHFVARERGKAGTTDAQRAVDSPYNTYKVQGLPPGPIGNPGEESVVAAASPAKGNWRFFVTVDPSTGETKFAATEAEHASNVREFEAWCSANPGKC